MTGDCLLVSITSVQGLIRDTDFILLFCSKDENEEYFVNLNDGSNEGMMHKSRPIFSTQFHPEAKGGPQDSSYLFEKYLENVALAKNSQGIYKDNRPTQLMLDIMSRERVGVEPTPLAGSG